MNILDTVLYTTPELATLAVTAARITQGNASPLEMEMAKLDMIQLANVIIDRNAFDLIWEIK